ncbi:MAG TPA: histidine phosphatase family protein [Blastocatellia bacterium]|nr:histidine phosphatase family protein [Blastocatellia bacterium]
MSYIYLIRHAQAGTRDNYDVLSELGRQQARLLGEHLASQGINLCAIYSGTLQRQRHTAELACEAIARAGLPVPDPVADERWDEFSLLSVYRAIARRMMEEDEQFARDVREMQEAIRHDPHTTSGATGRCDAAVIKAWMENRYSDYEGESWAAFRNRIENCSGVLSNHDPEKAIAVFTSATPIAILTGSALGLTDEKLVSILGVIHNTSVTLMRARGGGLRLFTFNSTPHLDSRTRTFR